MNEVKAPVFIRNFKCKGLDETWPATAARYALAEAMEGKGVEAEPEECMDAVMKLHDRWRIRLEELKHAGWKPVVKHTGFVYLMNCPIPCVKTNQTGLRPCNHSSVCPFCWCRSYVMTAYNRLGPAILGGLGKFNMERLTLWETHMRVRYPMTAWSPSTVLDGTKHRKSEHINRYLPLTSGAYSICSVEPEGDFWKMHVRTLALMPRTKRPPDDAMKECQDCTVMTTTRVAQGAITEQTLAAMLGRVGSYPVGMLNSNAQDTCNLLQAKTPKTIGGKRKLYRTADYYDGLRGFSSLASARSKGKTDGDSEDDTGGAEATG